jgi:glutathione S-transferase
MLASIPLTETGMAWLHLVALLALVQYLIFGALVGSARGKYGVQAPATTGNDVFERYYRVQMNTLELMVVLLPAMWIAAAYWDPRWVAVAGAVYLIGRMVYLRAYTRNPGSRALGFMLSIAPIALLSVAALTGAALRLMNGAAP